jgi:Flp pilus assembly protein TadG
MGESRAASGGRPRSVHQVPEQRFGLGRLRRRVALATARVLKFRQADQGATALDFALVALPFIFLMVSLLELAAVFLVYTTLENALANDARTIRTGQMQTSGTPPTAASFTTAICNNMGWLQSTCSSQLQVDVRTETQFANPTEPDPMSTGTFNSAVLTFTPGTAGQIVLVRAFYQWPLFMPVMDAALSKARNGIAVIVATTTFVNEPYS